MVNKINFRLKLIKLSNIKIDSIYMLIIIFNYL